MYCCRNVGCCCIVGVSKFNTKMADDENEADRLEPQDVQLGGMSQNLFEPRIPYPRRTDDIESRHQSEVDRLQNSINTLIQKNEELRSNLGLQIELVGGHDDHLRPRAVSVSVKVQTKENGQALDDLTVKLAQVESELKTKLEQQSAFKLQLAAKERELQSYFSSVSGIQDELNHLWNMVGAEDLTTCEQENMASHITDETIENIHFLDTPLTVDLLSDCANTSQSAPEGFPPMLVPDATAIQTIQMIPQGQQSEEEKDRRDTPFENIPSSFSQELVNEIEKLKEENKSLLVQVKSLTVERGSIETPECETEAEIKVINCEESRLAEEEKNLDVVQTTKNEECQTEQREEMVNDGGRPQSFLLRTILYSLASVPLQIMSFLLAFYLHSSCNEVQ